MKQFVMGFGYSKSPSSFTNFKLKSNHRKHGKHGIKEIWVKSFRTFRTSRVFRGYKASVNIYVRDYNSLD